MDTVVNGSIKQTSTIIQSSFVEARIGSLRFQQFELLNNNTTGALRVRWRFAHNSSRVHYSRQLMHLRLVVLISTSFGHIKLSLSNSRSNTTLSITCTTLSLSSTLPGGCVVKFSLVNPGSGTTTLSITFCYREVSSFQTLHHDV
jgi:hypothetical protein